MTAADEGTHSEVGSKSQAEAEVTSESVVPEPLHSAAEVPALHTQVLPPGFAGGPQPLIDESLIDEPLAEEVQATPEVELETPAAQVLSEAQAPPVASPDVSEQVGPPPETAGAVVDARAAAKTDPAVNPAAVNPAADTKAADTASPEPDNTSAEVASDTANVDVVAAPSDGAVSKPKPAVKVLEGLVTAVSAEEVDLDLPDGRKAVIYRRNFGLNEEDPSTIVSVGDRAIGAELTREDPKNRVVMSRAWALRKQNWEKLEASADESKFVSGKVISTNKNGLVLDVGVRGFVPASHVELEPVVDLKPYVGQVLEAKIIEIDPASERLVLSRRPILLRAQRQKVKALLTALSPGDVRTGTVVSLADYGAFVDLGGVRGLVHVSEMAWERIAKPADLVSLGDEVEVKVLDLNIKKRRIGLSIRQVKQDPLSIIEVGSIMTGRVARLVDFGAFIDLGVVEGLAHLSELAEYRVQAPEEVLTPGDEVRVKVISVDPKRRRVALSVRQAAEFGG